MYVSLCVCPIYQSYVVWFYLRFTSFVIYKNILCYFVDLPFFTLKSYCKKPFFKSRIVFFFFLLGLWYSPCIPLYFLIYTLVSYIFSFLKKILIFYNTVYKLFNNK